MTKKHGIELLSFIIYSAFYFSLIRATGIALFLPAEQSLLNTIDYTQHTVINYMLLLFLVSYVFLSNNYRFAKTYFSNPTILFLMAGTVMSIVFSISTFVSIKYVLTVMVVSFPPLIFAYHYGSEKMMRHLGYFIFVMVIVNLLYTFVFPQYAVMTGGHLGRWKGLFEHKNGFGPFFAISFFIIVQQIKYVGSILRFFYILSLPIIFLFIIKSGSATALVCFVLFLFFFPLLSISFRMRPLERFSVFLGASAFLLLVFIFLGDYLSQILFELTGRDATLTGRTEIWHILMSAVMEKPVTGYGAGLATRPEFMAQFQEEAGWGVSSPHNSFIDLLLNFGIPMACFISFLIFKIFFKGFFTIYKYKTELSYAVLACSLMIVLLAVSFTGSGAIVSRSVFWMYMVIGLTILSLHQRNRLPQIAVSLPDATKSV